MPPRLIDFLYHHPRSTFVLMGASFLAFGVATVNLFVQLKANIDLFLEYGLMVIEDGALQQLAELLGLTSGSMIFYLLFKLCERILVERLVARRLARRLATKPVVAT